MLEGLAVGLLQPVESAADHAPHVLGRGDVGLGESPPQRPCLSVPGDVAPVPQVLHEAVEEQRVSFRALVEQGRELVREPVRGERGVEIGAHVGREQPPRTDLPSVGAQVEEAVVERGVGPLEVGVPKRDEEENALPLVPEAMGQVADEVDAGGIGPLEVLGHDHDRELARGRVERVGHLAEHAFLVGPHRLALQQSGVFGEGGGKLQAPGRRERAQELARAFGPSPDHEAAHPVQEGQEGLAAPVLLGAAPAEDGDHVFGPRPPQELGHEGRLADARLAGDEKEGSRPPDRLLERGLEGRELGGTTDERASRRLRSRGRRSFFSAQALTSPVRTGACRWIRCERRR